MVELLKHLVTFFFPTQNLFTVSDTQQSEKLEVNNGERDKNLTQEKRSRFYR